MAHILKNISLKDTCFDGLVVGAADNSIAIKLKAADAACVSLKGPEKIQLLGTVTL